MTWAAQGSYAITSEPYLVTRNWTADGWVYLAFRDKSLIGRASTSDAAKGLCG